MLRLRFLEIISGATAVMPSIHEGPLLLVLVCGILLYMGWCVAAAY